MRIRRILQLPDLPFYDFPLSDEIRNRAQGLFESKRKIHGANPKLPSGYAYTLVPPTATIKPTLDPSISIRIARSRNFIKTLVAIFQVIYSSWTLYEARGDQIDRFGYSSFSLTVSPYVVMSLINLAGSLLLPSYATLFLVRSEAMDEVEKLQHGGRFHGVVGTLQQSLDDDSPILTTHQVIQENTFVLSPDQSVGEPKPQVTISAWANFEERDIRLGPLAMAKCNSSLDHLSLLCHFFGFVFGFLSPLCIIWGLSHFHTGRSSLAERVWIILWYSYGSMAGLIITLLGTIATRLVEMTESARNSSPLAYVTKYLPHKLKDDEQFAWQLGVFMLYGFVGIGRMVVVGQMIKEYGDCRRF